MLAFSTSDPGVGRSRGLRFELAGPACVDGLVELFERNAVASVTSGFDPFPLTATKARWIALEQHKDAYFVAARGARLFGMSMLRGFDEGYEIPSFGVFVDHASQGEGIGRRLTNWTIEQARMKGCQAVRLSVYSDNSVARRLYASLGFREQDRSAVAREGAFVEKIVMRLDLD